MTNENKTLEERTAGALKNAGEFMENANSILIEKKNHPNPDKKAEGYLKAINTQNVALYEQNRVIIDYLKEIYKELRR